MLCSLSLRRPSLARLGLGLLACSLLAGCGGRAKVQGMVTFRDQPVDGGRIFFLPEGEPVGRPTVYAAIDGGQYCLPASEGPALGRHRVEIVWFKKTGKQVPTPGDPGFNTDDMKQILPAAYNSKSMLSADVQRGTNTFDFALQERP